MGINMKPWVLVPVKRLENAKIRLSSVLSDSQRMMLARAMLLDVLGTMRESSSIAGVVVVTADKNAGVIARDMGAHVLPEVGNSDLNAAIGMGLHAFGREQIEAAIVVAADIPQLSVDDVDAVVAALDQHPAVLVRGQIDGGTNIMGLRPPGLLVPLFGEGSFNRHAEALRSQGTEPFELILRHVGIDIDRPADLNYFSKLGLERETQSYLKRIGFAPCRGGISDSHLLNPI